MVRRGGCWPVLPALVRAGDGAGPVAMTHDVPALVRIAQAERLRRKQAWRDMIGQRKVSQARVDAHNALRPDPHAPLPTPPPDPPARTSHHPSPPPPPAPPARTPPQPPCPPLAAQHPPTATAHVSTPPPTPPPVT